MAKNDGATFVDPSGSLFDLLRRLQTIDNAWKFLGSLDQLKAVYLELVDAPKNSPRLDRLDGWIAKAHRRYIWTNFRPIETDLLR